MPKTHSAKVNMAAVHLEQAEKNIPGILRKGDGKALKEKIIAYYESILKVFIDGVIAPLAHLYLGSHVIITCA